MHSRTAVVILNWNNRNFLEKFLPNVEKHSSDHAEIIVADNGSTDDSITFLQNNFPSIKIIRNISNEGYAGGYNAALANVNNEYIVLLNSDVEVSENWLPPLLSLMDQHPEAGACQPKILSYHTPDSFEYAGAAGGFIDKYGYPFCRGRIFNSIEKDINQYGDTRPVFWASGACMMVRTSVFKKLNGFDPHFFSHMEEIDLCWRMQNAGHMIYYCHTSKVFHIGGGSLHKSNPKKTYLNFRNNLLMVYKNAVPARVNTILAFRWFLDLVASMKFLISGSFPDFIAVWHARRDFKRLKSQYPRPFSDESISNEHSRIFIYPKSIIWDYYLCRRKKFSSLHWE